MGPIPGVMADDLLLAIDQGTTGTTVLALDRDLRVQARTTREFRQIYPRAGWVEHDLEDLWASVTGGVQDVLAQIDPKRIRAIGITNQRETVGLWDRQTTEAPHPAIVWQCRRTAARCQQLREAGHADRIRDLTGLVVDPYFSGTKAEWLLEHVPEAHTRAEAGDWVLGTVDSFLVHRLTGQVVTDVTNASRTMLFDIHRMEWSSELLHLLSVPKAALAEVRSSSEVYGTTRNVPGLPDGIPVAGLAGDQHAALFGQACFQPGDVKCTYGTGAFILIHTGTEPVASQHRLLTTLAWQLGPKAAPAYALEGSVFVAGAAVQWLRDGLGIIEGSDAIEPLARSVPDSGDLVFVPALTGLGAPHWRAEARGVVRGITRDTTKAHLARATLEGIALQVHDVMEAMKKDVARSNPIRVDGGAAADDLLLEIQAELAQQSVIRPDNVETTAAGAACLAGLATGAFDDLEAIRAAVRTERTFAPGATEIDRDALLAKWRAALDAC